MTTNPGEVWLADLGLAAKLRPVLIVSRHDADPPRNLVLYVPLTTQNRNSRYEVQLGKLRFLRESSTANIQGLGALSTVRLTRKLGSLPSDRFSAVQDAIKYALAL